MNAAVTEVELAGGDRDPSREPTEADEESWELPTADKVGSGKTITTDKEAPSEAKNSQSGVPKRGRPTNAVQLQRLARQRSNSVGGIIEALSRKREREEERARQDWVPQPFKRSVKIQRSPPKSSGEGEQPETKMGDGEAQTKEPTLYGKAEKGKQGDQDPLMTIMKELQSMRKEMMNEFEKDRSETKKDKEEMKKEMKKLREEMLVREVRWKEGHEKMEDSIRKLEEGMEMLVNKEKEREETTNRRIEALEEKAMQATTGAGGAGTEVGPLGEGSHWKLKVDQLDRNWEMTERRRRRNNIKVSGRKWTQANEREEAEKFLKDELGVEVKAREVRVFNNDRTMAVVELECWEDKNEVMKKKNGLAGKMIFIDNDLTRKEREIQKKLVRIKKTEKEKGKQAKVGYMKIQIQGKWLFWDEDEGELKTDRNFQNRRRQGQQE